MELGEAITLVRTSIEKSIGETQGLMGILHFNLHFDHARRSLADQSDDGACPMNAMAITLAWLEIMARGNVSVADVIKKAKSHG